MLLLMWHIFAIIKWGLIDEITGLKIISPKDLNTNMSELVLLICTIDINAITSIYKQLLTQGFEKAQIFNMREYFLEYLFPI